MALIGFRSPLTYHPWPWSEYTEEQNQNRKSETRSQEYYIGFLERSALGDSENEKHIDFITRDGIGRSRKKSFGTLKCNRFKKISS